VQAHQKRHRKDEDHQVRGNVEACITIQNLSKVVALYVRTILHSGRRDSDTRVFRTLKRGDQYHGNRASGDKDSRDVYEDPESPVGRKAQVESEDTQFYQGQIEQVDNLVCEPSSGGGMEATVSDIPELLLTHLQILSIEARSMRLAGLTPVDLRMGASTPAPNMSW
jgi:hypothetical protein